MCCRPAGNSHAAQPVLHCARAARLKTAPLPALASPTPRLHVEAHLPHQHHAVWRAEVHAAATKHRMGCRHEAIGAVPSTRQVGTLSKHRAETTASPRSRRLPHTSRTNAHTAALSLTGGSAPPLPPAAAGRAAAPASRRRAKRRAAAGQRRRCCCGVGWGQMTPLTSGAQKQAMLSVIASAGRPTPEAALGQPLSKRRCPPPWLTACTAGAPSSPHPRMIIRECAPAARCGPHGARVGG